MITILETYQSLTIGFYKNTTKTIKAKQGDNDTRFVLITFLDNNGKTVNIDDSMDLEFKMVTPNNKSIYHNDCLTVQSDGKVLITLDDNMLASAGTARAELSIIKDKKVLSTTYFRIIIEKSIVPASTIVATNDFAILRETLNDAKEKESIATEAAERAETFAEDAKKQADLATTKANAAATSETNAANSATSAANSASTATTKETEANNSAISAQTSEENALNSSILAKSYAVGETATRTGEDTDNAKYYSLQAKKVSEEVMEELNKKENSSNKVTSIGNNPTDTQYPSAKAVKDYVESLPEPMIFKGSLGTNGTITTLPSASSSNEGFTYKVITTGTYASQSAKVGDTFISDGTNWVLIPSGDEPSGTVTSVGLEVPNGMKVSNSPITTSGNISISMADGYSIPTDTEQDNWDSAYTHSKSTHARTDATKVENSTTNGNILINGVETNVYTHPGGTNPHGTTASDVGLGNVPNVVTNDQTVTYTESTTLVKLTSGEKLSIAFGKISKAVTDLISHLADTVKHITSTERTNWNAAKTHADSAHAPSNAQANVIETVKVNDTALTPSSKAVNITVPTKVSQLTNDSEYLTTHPSISTSTDTTSTASPSAGGTFTAVDSVTRDNNGHVTNVNTKTVTLPSTSVTVDSALSSTSTNPVQNKVVNAAFGTKPTLEKWTCPVKVGEWSRVCSITNYSVGVLTVTFSQNSQTLVYKYCIGTGYNSAFISQVASSGFKVNSDIGVRITRSGALSYFVEILNNFGYDGATSVSAFLSYEKLDNINGVLKKLTIFTATDPNSPVVTSIVSKPDGIVSPKYYGDLVGNADSATSLKTSAGSATQPVYFSGGKPVACTYTLGKSVPSNAVFTDTTYSNGTGGISVGTSLTRGGYEETVYSTITVSGVDTMTNSVQYDGDQWFVQCPCTYNSDLIPYIGVEYTSITSDNSDVQNSSFDFVSPSGPNELTFYFNSPTSATDFNYITSSCTITLSNGSTTNVVIPYQVLLGNYNVPNRTTSKNTATMLYIGNGNGNTSNALRLTYGSQMYLGTSGKYNASGADYAEYFEWLDGNTENENRRGLFVTLEGNKIRIAQSTDEYILGAVSRNACIIGNADEEWQNRWMKDEFGELIYETVEDEDGSLIEQPIQNPEYDSSLEYVSRSERKEWDIVGMFGVLALIDNGVCEINSYATVGENGTAVSADENSINKYRVIERISDSVIQIIFR